MAEDPFPRHRIPPVTVVPPERPTPIDPSKRDGFEEARSSVDWAEAHIPTLQDRIIKWHHSNPYELFVEADSESSDQLLAAYQVKPLDPSIPIDIGVILNSIRSALDITVCAACRRNGETPTRYTKFPIHPDKKGLDGEIKTIKSKKWLSQSEADKVEALQPYKGGDAVLYALHHLDIARKHERFVTAAAAIAASQTATWGVGVTPAFRRMNDKTILYRLPPSSRFIKGKGHSGVTAAVVINEPTLGLVEKPVIPLLRRYAARVAEVIDIVERP